MTRELAVQSPSDSRDIPPEPRSRMSDADRSGAFSDGVLSITITLLVFQVTRPEYDPGRLLNKLLAQRLSYVASRASCLTVGVIGLNHRSVFARVRYLHPKPSWAKLLVLMTSAPILFPMAVLAPASLERRSGRRQGRRGAVRIRRQRHVPVLARPVPLLSRPAAPARGRHRADLLLEGVPSCVAGHRRVSPRRRGGMGVQPADRALIFLARPILRQHQLRGARRPPFPMMTGRRSPRPGIRGAWRPR